METIFDALVQVKKDSFGTWHFDCPIGLWGAQGKDKLRVRSEAQHYFYQYLSDGEYDEIAKRYGIEL